MAKFTIIYKVTVDVRPMEMRSLAVREALNAHLKQACSSEDTGLKGSHVSDKSEVCWRAFGTDKTIDNEMKATLNNLFD